DDYGDLRLAEGSPGVDYGLTEYLPPDIWDLDGDGDTAEPLPLDVAGNPRVQGEEVDLGAYERAGAPVAVSVQATGGAVVVPAEGGAFTAHVRLTNAGGEAQTVAAGVGVVLPNGQPYGPLVERSVVVP